MYFKTDRVTFRELKAEDEKFYIQTYTDPQLMKYTGVELNTAQAKSAFLTTLTATQKSAANYMMFVLCRNNTTTPLGFIAFKDLSLSKRSAEIGIILQREAQGKGIAFHCVSAVVTYGFDKLSLNNIFANLKVANKAGIKLINRLGFEPVKSNCEKNTPSDVQLYSKIKETI
ncbi:MAG: GNAT family N-acetyltransferase [Gammaproteobacteria bacterium]|nr:GNAT family N-acetyltransferase [Gammaproteobacteria bacterium]